MDPLLVIMLLIAGLIGVLLGYNYGVARTKRKILKHTKEQLVRLTPPADEAEVINIRIEKHDDGLFAYQVKDGRFLAQAKHADDMVNTLKNSFGNRWVRLAIHNEDGSEYIKDHIPEELRVPKEDS